MLQVIRKQVHGVVGWFILALIIASFALWGISSYLGGGNENPVVTVGDKEFFQRDVNRAYMRLKQSNPQLEKMDETLVRNEAVKQLIRDTVLGLAVEDLGLEVDDQAVKKIISEIPAFQKDGKFDKTIYTLALSSQGLSSAQFLDQTRLALAKDQLRRSISDTGFSGATELDNYFRLYNQKREIEYVITPLSIKELPQADADIEAYYQEHADRYQIPEQVSLSYLELKLEDIAAEVDVSEEQLLTYYEEQKDNLTTAERRKVRHILFSQDAKQSDEALLAEAEQAKQRLDAGEDFVALAQQLSDDPLSKKKGGDLGLIRPGDMVKEFEDAAMALGKDAISAPVKTEYGYHLIQVTDLQAASTKSFAEAKVQLDKDFRKQAAENTFFELGEKLSQVSYENPDSLDAAALAIGREIKQTGLFNKTSGTDIAAEQAVRDAAFKADVLEGNNSELIELGAERMVVVRVKEHKPASNLPLETVKASIVQTLNQKAAHDAAVASASNLSDAVQAGQQLAALVTADQLEIKQPGFVGRMDKDLQWPIKQAVFAAPKPTAGKPSTMLVDLGPQGQAVVVVKAVQPGTLADADQEMRDQVAASLGRGRNTIEFDALMAQLETAQGAVIRMDQTTP